MIWENNGILIRWFALMWPYASILKIAIVRDSLFLDR